VVVGCGVVVVGCVVAVPLVDPVLVCAPPPTLPFAASCCWIYCFNSGEMLFAVQPLLDPLPPIDNTLIDTPQTLAATLIGICALTGMLALSTFRSSGDC
jgi:hypothetical protein